MQHLQPNTTLQGGKYRIERVLGQGGFGNTYVGYNTEFEETVAIKEFFMKGVTERDETTSVISVSNADNVQQFEEQREKFKKEALRIRKLDNPHIVKVHDLFEENGTAYYVMDFVEGENLSQRLKRTGKPMAERKVREIFLQLLDALKAVHDAGMWHLDIKPANIMLDKEGNVKLIDFGASKQLNAQKGGATTSTAISYTNGYAPREQMEQNYDKFGPWTDIYALGATLYNLLTNKRPPMPSDIDDDISEDKHNALPFPATTSTEMKQLVVQMMQTNRMKRPQTINDISVPSGKKVNKKVESGETTLLVSPDNKSEEETIVVPTDNKPVYQPQGKKEDKSEEYVSYLDEEPSWKEKLRDYWWNFKGVIIIVSCLSLTSILGFSLKTCDRITGWDKPQVESEAPSEDNIMPQSVDLGLSVEWASFNIGARYPYETGDYYWWASTNPIKNETDAQKIFDLDETGQSFKKYNSLGMVISPEDDVAHKSLGGGWRVPTPDELNELVTKCTWEEAEYMNMKGYNVIGNNGNKIFLPYAGNPENAYWMGSYMSNSMSPNNVAYFYSLVFSDKTMKEIGLIDEKVKICVMEVARNSAAVVRPVKDLAYDVVEVMPEYPGGSEALSKYLSENIKYPEEAEEKGIEGKVILTFIVEKDGSVSEIEVANPVNPLLDNEAVRVVKSMQGWIPGKQNGKTVRVKYTIPVTFKLQ